MQFPVHTIESAPERSRPILEGAQKKLGFIPNIIATFASAPTLLESYAALTAKMAETSLSPTEQQVVMMTVNYENECEYCMAAHSALAGMSDVHPDVIEGLRTGMPFTDPKLEALRTFARAMIEKRGWASEEELAAFQAAGYGPQQALEVVLGIGFKTLSNFTNHIAQTPLDAAFAPAAWNRSEKALAS